MTTILSFLHQPVRALVVEQLNTDQWHVVVVGADVPVGSWESRPTGAESFRSAVADALDIAELSGLPVFVGAYQQGLRPLSALAAPSSFSRRRGRSSLAEIMFGRGAA